MLCHFLNCTALWSTYYADLTLCKINYISIKVLGMYMYSALAISLKVIVAFIIRAYIANPPVN